MNKNFILFDDDSWIDLLPLTFTRPISELRIGILTITEKWEKYLNQKCSFLTQDYLQEKFPIVINDNNIAINGSILPTPELIDAISSLQTGEQLVQNGTLIAIHLTKDDIQQFAKQLNQNKLVEYPNDFLKIKYPWDIFTFNGIALQADFELITKGRKSAPLSKTIQVIGNNPIFVEEGVKAECAIINTLGGPVYLGKNSEIMEGSLIRGPFAACEHAIVKMGAKIYGPTTLGPEVRAGGELNNVVFIGNSNKGHDGFIGNAVIGEWCNIGADSNNSNLKNNYAEVKVWNYRAEMFIKTGLQFCGLIMGDHSKCGINTMFNTGTVVGVSANVFGDGFPRNFIPSFAWGGNQGFMTYTLPKVYETAEKVMERRNKKLDDTEKKIMQAVFEYTAKYRRF